jgi:HSP20 family protein
MFTGGRLPTPWELMRRMNAELERLAEAVETQRAAAMPTSRANAPAQTRDAGLGDDLLRADWTPRLDVVERDGAMVLRAELPGVKPDEIVVNVENGVLSIWGERQQERREERDRFVRTERVHGTFLRSIPLPEGADEEHIEASFRDGVLELTIPVSERERGRRIAVQSSHSQETS